MAVTPDGADHLRIREDGTVKVWERGSGRCVATLEGHGARVLGVAVTPDGAQIISGSDDSTVKVWERGSGRCVATLEGHGARVWGVAVTPDGAQIISGSEDGTVKVWERSSGRCVATLAVGMGIGSGRGGDAGWRRSSRLRRPHGEGMGAEQRALCVATLAGHGARVLGVAVTPDGAQIIPRLIRPHGEGVERKRGALCGHAGRAWG
ncbi:MAG: hypothetical protein R3A44_37125 [Caldilineaceae bacterium]